jgi:hypothetical protein
VAKLVEVEEQPGEEKEASGSGRKTTGAMTTDRRVAPSQIIPPHHFDKGLSWKWESRRPGRHYRNMWSTASH